ncbi:hypothetical protein [Salirhabdus salicampi]|uniref:hypothetical protein n=1 Tax=Salirhabdus salicampi TaxID=476102 RepID=UPI0020C44903|nr:hypothetical protein [Salirhabdus salicampi]MCP8615403.1 hypothetical protein [Salirhabdus salicampi]
MKKLSIVVIPLLIISIIINVFLYQENQAYELYLSEQLRNTISPLSSSILRNEEILREIVAREKITATQVEDLNNNYYNIAKSYQTILHTGIKTKKIPPHYISNRPTLIFADELPNYFRSFVEESSVEIISHQFNHEEYKEILKVANLHFQLAELIDDKIVGAKTDGMTSEYWSYPHYNNAVSKTYWIELLSEMETIAINFQLY